jgi:hypothetical protein
LVAIISLLLLFNALNLLFAMGDFPKENTIYLIEDSQAQKLATFADYSKVSTANTTPITPSVKYQYLDYRVARNYNPFLALSDWNYAIKLTDGKTTGWIVSKNMLQKIKSQISDNQRKQRQLEATETRNKKISEYIAKNPTSKKYQQNFINGEVVKGMNLDDVKLCWGEPDVFNQLSIGYYQFGVGKPIPRKYCYFRNGVVVDIQYFNY